ncbi:hypothetical protein AKO1_002238 [Acrasis kona]
MEDIVAKLQEELDVAYDRLETVKAKYQARLAKKDEEMENMRNEYEERIAYLESQRGHKNIVDRSSAPSTPLDDLLNVTLPSPNSGGADLLELGEPEQPKTVAQKNAAILDSFAL